jgi:hypothetical protein
VIEQAIDLRVELRDTLVAGAGALKRPSDSTLALRLLEGVYDGFDSELPR